MNAMEEIQTLYQELLATPFPRGSNTKDLTVDLAGTDGYCAGCVSVFLERGTLDEWRIWVLRNCLGSLLDLRARCAPNDAAYKTYIALWLRLTKIVLATTRTDEVK